MAMAKALTAIILKEAEELFKRIKVRVSRYRSRQVLLSVWAYAFRLLGIVLIILGILQGHYEVGFLVLFHSYFGNIWESVDELSTSTQDFVTSKFSIARLKVILNEPVTIDNEAGKLPFVSAWKKIIVQNVSFSYGDNQVLKDLSFEIRRGEKVGIIGLSGAGKSTLFKLLLKEREEFSGEILFNGMSIKNIQKSDYFSYVSVVLQDTEVFNFSLRDNITVTNPRQSVNTKLLDKALSVAHVSDFLAKLPQGLETVIGEKGVKLSGGERQRLGIARAIFKQPQLLLLDEATSHLDLESEEKIQDSLHHFFQDVTAIVIAHRLTTIKEMDKIMVIEEGKLIEMGNFEELYKKQGRFFELWEKQKL
jgi:ABC-type multidrug transport system fused ATPase/permease subunit